jgi:hypothetical protein
MLNGHSLIVDVQNRLMCNLLRPWVTCEFTNFNNHIPVPNSIYVLGVQCILDSPIETIIELANDPTYSIVYASTSEGSDTLYLQLQHLNLYELAVSKKILVIGGGGLGPEINLMVYDFFLGQILGPRENILAQRHSTEVFTKTNKPYNFLFLNGRARPHRKYLYHRLKDLSLLDRALWTMLEGRDSYWTGNSYIHNTDFELFDGDNDIMIAPHPLKSLPPEYEVKQFRSYEIDINDGPIVKSKLFTGTWGDNLVTHEPYIDTYFSLVTETAVIHPYSFRTEKIAKPLLMGHPWVCATSSGFYRDIRNLGFKTFDHLIDESFDSIDNHQTRMDRIVQVVQDLCNQDLASFLAAAQDVCKYNQQHLQEFSSNKAEFPTKFFNFINQHRE